MNLWSDFPTHSSNDWKKKLENDLKNNDPSSLTWNHSIGAIDPLISINTNSDFQISPSKLKNLSWKIDESNFSNKFILKILSFGINSLIFDNISYEESKLKDVMHSIILQHVLINTNTPNQVISSWLKWIENNHSECKGSFRYDPIQSLLFNPNQQNSFSNHLINWRDLIQNLSKTDYPCIYVDGSVYGNALANIEDEVAYILAHTNEYIEYLKNNNQTCPKKLIVKVAVSPQYLIELGKIRALRFLLERVVNHHEIPTKIEIECINNGAFFNPVDQESNLMRFTTSYMTAMNTGCESIEVTDYLSKNENSYSKNISANIALILKEESHLDKVHDPAKGSYYIESITKSIVDKSWNVFLSIEKEGGWIKYLENLKAQKKCEQNKKNMIEALSNNTVNIIGFNKYSAAKLDFKKEVDINGFNPLNLNMFA